MDWIHNFAITSTSRHKKGHTIYKIISIIFSKNIPEALSTIQVWKRYKDVKELYKQIQRKHHEKGLKGRVPELRTDNFFKRHDPEVIRARKENILQLLYFIAEHPALYQSQAFSSFFERNTSPGDSPYRSPTKEQRPEIPANPSPTREPDDALSQSGSVTSDSWSLVAMEEHVAETQPAPDPTPKPQLLSLIKADSVDYSDYLYEAAYEFSQAVQAEANGKYKEAFDLYKNGIEKMLQGVRSDKDDNRRRVVKAKVSRYLEHAEEIFQKHILNCRDDLFTPLGEGLTLDNPEVQNLERPLNFLARYKVLDLIGGLMQVLDVTTKICYVMKPIEKSASHTLFLPQDILYMTPLVNYFQSDTTVFLLLKLASGGNLWDYLQSHANKIGRKPATPASIESIFVEPQALADEDEVVLTTAPAAGSSNSSPNEAGYDSGFVEPIVRPNSLQVETVAMKEFVPSFDTLSSDMDAANLVELSQKLLNSVANTLEVLRIDDNPTNLDLTDVPEFQTILRHNAEYSQSLSEIVKLNTELTDRLTYHRESVEPEGGAPVWHDLSFLDGSIKQWARELVVAIQSLHSNGIICGDLSMDNLLLGSNGQLRLTYFYRRDQHNNICLELVSRRARQRWYVAPERPLTFSADWWSLGVILYELVTKQTYVSYHPCGPFFYYEVQYPEGIEVAEDVRDLIEGLLQINPELRFGLADIMNHRYFGTTNWTEVKAKGKICL